MPSLLKFWRSPKLASKDRNKSPSPSPSPPPPRPDAPPAAHLHGLGLALPQGLDTDSRHVPAHAPGWRTAPRPSSTSAQDASPSSTRSPPQDSTKGTADARPSGNGNVLRERNGDHPRSVSAQSTLKPPPADRSLSPSLGHSLASGSRLGPYGGVASIDFADRDPSQIYAPTTWSEMAHHELVVNLSPRERTRQEILWEVVASEERYVAELRSLVTHYANPLLHPLVPSPSLTPSPRFGFSPDLAPHPHQHPSASTSSASLPIASRFARTPEPDAHDRESDGVRQGGAGGPSRAAAVRIADVPDMEPSARRIVSGASAHAHASLPHLVPTGATGRRHASASSTTLHGGGGPASHAPPPSASASASASLSTRIASAFRPRQSAPAPASASTGAGAGGGAPVVLPAELRDALEACVDMLRGHEELSARLREQWARAFPLVRGLAAIWSNQPWFLSTYTSYVLSLEPALSSLDVLLPSPHPHSPHAASSSSSSSSSKLSSSSKRLAHVLRELEAHAADAGESSLGICLSKPLMRLGKLPLLMQALLYHTDPTTHEWEKTRAMALEVDALVRSIEDEKVEEEERERTRDALARIDGVKDKALMAPRAARILISEQPAPAPPAASAGTAPTTRGGKLARRVSAATGGQAKSGREGRGSEWLVGFTDVVVRAVKTGETSIPGSFSRQKEKRGKQGAPRKVGKTRNTYRFVRIERWEPREVAARKLEELNERRRTGRAPASDDEEGEDEDGDEADAESRMSFRYDADSPQPLAHPTRTFLSPSSSSSSKPTERGPSPLSPPTAAATAAATKFGSRLRAETPALPRATTPVLGARFDAPTLSSEAKKAHGHGHGPVPGSPPRARQPARERAALGSSGGGGNGVSGGGGGGGGGLAHARDESSFALYSMWAGAHGDE